MIIIMIILIIMILMMMMMTMMIITIHCLTVAMIMLTITWLIIYSLYNVCRRSRFRRPALTAAPCRARPIPTNVARAYLVRVPLTSRCVDRDVEVEVEVEAEAEAEAEAEVEMCVHLRMYEGTSVWKTGARARSPL